MIDGKTYPIGTSIRFKPGNAACLEAIKDDDKLGEIVGFDYSEQPIIYLPESNNISSYSTPEIPASWSCRWASIRLAPRIGEQLQFSFMSE